MVIMLKEEFYSYYIPALMKALSNQDKWEQFNVKGPEFFLDTSNEKQKEIEIYIDKMVGKDSFLDDVSYYFDAISHGFCEINGIKIETFKENLESKILEYKKKYIIE